MKPQILTRSWKHEDVAYTATYSRRRATIQVTGTRGDQEVVRIETVVMNFDQYVDSLIARGDLGGVHASDRRGQVACGVQLSGSERVNTDRHPELAELVTCTPCKMQLDLGWEMAESTAAMIA
jgi:hypothetical protein